MDNRIKVEREIVMTGDVPGVLQSLFSSHKVLQDVLVGGYVDRDGDPPTFRIHSKIVFLETNNGYIKLDSSVAGGIDVSDSLLLEVSPDLTEDPSIEPMYARMGRFCFGENLELEYLSVKLFTNKSSGGDVLVAMQFELAHGNRLLLDADWTFGITFSAEGATDEWRDRIKSRYPDLVELCWRRD
jgi:hypothetical protein